jgi:hypothetical protein
MAGRRRRRHDVDCRAWGSRTHSPIDNGLRSEAIAPCPPSLVEAQTRIQERQRKVRHEVLGQCASIAGKLIANEMGRWPRRYGSVIPDDTPFGGVMTSCCEVTASRSRHLPYTDSKPLCSRRRCPYLSGIIRDLFQMDASTENTRSRIESFILSNIFSCH